MEHSKLPWSANSERPYVVAQCGDEFREYVTCGMKDASHGCFDWPVIPYQQRQANAAFIVQACNEHSSLTAKAALVDKLVEWHESPDDETGLSLNQKVIKLLDVVGEILRKAKELNNG